MSLLSRYFTEIPNSVSIRNFRYYLVAHIAYNFAIVVHSLWLVLFFLIPVKPLFYFNLFSVPFFLFCILINRKGYHLLTTSTAMIEIVGHQLLATYLLGIESGFQHYLLVVALFPFIMPKWHLFIKILIFLMPLISYMFILFYFQPHVTSIQLEPSYLTFLKGSNLLFAFICVGILGAHFNYAGNKSEEQLDKENEKSELLLLNILPRKIASKLKESSEIISERFPEASILFADLVGFTHFSEKINPEELVLILNNYFSEFDALVEKYQLEKIKTIGDAYMVAAGVPDKITDHALVMAEFSLDMLNAFHACNLKNGYDMDIRIGIHCGTVAAGVIGMKKFTYDLWGDTVNIASRLESSGCANRIQVSDEFYHQCKDHFEFEKRGLIQVKGKGEILTYFLTGKTPAKESAYTV
ncbi:MAG TPA: adenylate/guanylate cyclase domain-containing protein [Bacteroidia bacterium]|nr:adenylate/guanylate cyclase domain-containing protein [Bacteroidia bacterium]HNP97868.1 adenylate/guanylate cyclase domain-containing protein [Bacteroidia bacterium]